MAIKQTKIYLSENLTPITFYESSNYINTTKEDCIERIRVFLEEASKEESKKVIKRSKGEPVKNKGPPKNHVIFTANSLEVTAMRKQMVTDFHNF